MSRPHRTPLRNRSTAAILLLIAAICLPMLTGCKSKQKVYIPPPQVRAQPIDSRSADLLINEAVQYLATELPQAPGVRDTRHRLVLGLGPIEVSNFADPQRFVTAMRQINSRLMRNAALTRLFRMVQVSVASSQAITQALGGAPAADFGLPDSDADTGPAKYDPRDIYILTGKFTQYGDNADLDRSLWLSVSVEHPHSRQVVLTKDFRRNFRWDTASGTWQPVQP